MTFTVGNAAGQVLAMLAPQGKKQMKLIRTGNLIINADQIVEAIYRADEGRLELVYSVTDSAERSDYDGNHVSEKHEPYCRTLTGVEAESVWSKLIGLC